MSDYSKIVDFAAKDALLTGNPAKAAKGTEIDNELNAISTAIATKVDETSGVMTTPQINDTSADHQYVFAVNELSADRTVTLPLLTGNDEFVFKDHAVTLTNKTVNLTSNTLSGTKAQFSSACSDGDFLFVGDVSGGDVTGAASSTDNAVARFDSTTGKIIQNSAFVVDDSGHVSSFGGNIKFPASQAASADANTLDDYEEGTWTPSIGGTATYTSQIGTYTKIGRMVFCQMYLQINAIGTGSGGVISGLPFTASAASAGGGVVTYWQGTVAALSSMTAYVASGAATLTFYGSGTTTATTSTQQTPLTGGTIIAAQFSYFV